MAARFGAARDQRKVVTPDAEGDPGTNSRINTRAKVNIGIWSPGSRQEARSGATKVI
jgi:hypothetical protein